MFNYGVSENEILITRKQLKKNIHTQHPVATRVMNKVERLTWQWSGISWLFLFGLFFSLNALFSAPTSEFIKAHSIFWPIFDKVFLPLLGATFFAVVIKGVSRSRFYRKNNLPTEKLPQYHCNASVHRSSCDASISVNPATGYAMRGSVDTGGNTFGHSSRY